MRAALCTRLDGPSALEIADIPDPVPGSGDVVIKVRAAGLNFMDTLITRGKYQIKPELPFSPSAEVAGVVEAVGPGVDSLQVGDRVAAYVGHGGAREKIAVACERCISVPEGVPLETAAGLHVTYGTAMYGLVTRASVRAGEYLCVLGASGGAGLAAVEVGAALGARVIAVASSAEKLAVCASHGASELVNYADCDLKQALRDVTGGIGPDVIYDCVGGDHAQAALRALRTGGRYLVIGFASGKIPDFPANIVMLKDGDLLGINWGGAAAERPAEHAANMSTVFDWILDGRLVPEMASTRPLEQIADAISEIADRRAVGKLVITL